jgi:hypothetical protein
VADQIFSLTVEEPVGLAREKEPVRIGIPLPRGKVKKTDQIFLCNKQAFVPLQTTRLASWPDGSIKWFLLDFFAQCSPNSKNTYTVMTGHTDRETEPPALRKELTVRERDHAFEVDTGAAVFVVPKDRLAPFSSVVVNGLELLEKKGSVVILKDSDSKIFASKVKSIGVEEKGPLRSTIMAAGVFTGGSGKELLHCKLRITFFAGLTSVNIELQIHNPNAAKHPGGIWDLDDPGSILFREFSLQVSPMEALDTVKWRSTSDQGYQHVQTDDWSIYQDSSGGAKWNSPNHLGRSGNLTVTFQGFRINADKKNVEDGRRANPATRYEGNNFWIEGAIRNFWQNFPKAIRIRQKEIDLALFPEESTHAFELQGGEKKRHEIFLEFGQDHNDDSNTQYFLHPLKVIPNADDIRSSGAFASLIPESIEDSEYYAYVKHGVEGPNSFFCKREVIDEYGWRNFGDLYADHEAVNHRGECPFVSHYNNQYDFIFGGILQFLNTGDHRWFELLQDAARHMIDIDIYHTNKDKAAYNHGLFWHTAHYEEAGTSTHRTYSKLQLKGKVKRYYGGGPSNEHNYTSGLLHYYYLTGDIEAKNAVLELAEWVLGMDDGSRTILSFFDTGPTGLASQTVSPNYHKPGRGAGNSINALLDGFRLSSSKNYLEKAEELIQRCIHPHDNISELSLDEPEYRWSYLVFLQVLTKFLHFKEEVGEFDYIYFYTRDSLIHYTTWMAAHEKPYQEVLHKVEIPTETWPAHDVRKSCIFYQASRYVTEEQRTLFLEKGKYYFRRSLDDLFRYDTAFLTRPLVILIVYGLMPLWYQQHKIEPVTRNHDFDFGKPVEFIPQKKRVMTRFDPRLWFRKG